MNPFEEAAADLANRKSVATMEKAEAALKKGKSATGNDVWDWLADHPRSETGAIAKAFGIKVSVVSNMLGWLKEQDRITTHRDWSYNHDCEVNLYTIIKPIE